MDKLATPELSRFPSASELGYLDAVPTVSHPVAVQLLLPGTLVTVRTRNSQYRLHVVDGRTRQVTVSGGWVFPVGTEAELLGALGADGSPRLGWIIEGLQLQLLTKGGPVLTSVVESVEVDVDAASPEEESPEDEETVEH
jgi:hypothetical protein